MKMSLNILINERSIRKDGTCVIYLQYSFDHKRRPLLNTGIEIPPNFWDKKSGSIRLDLPLKFGIADDLNYKIKKMFRVAEDLIIVASRNKIQDPATFVKANFHPSKDIVDLKEIENKVHKNDVSQNLGIYFQIDDYIQSKTKKVCKDMPRIYRNMKEHLLEFEAYRGEPITFASLNLTFYEEFVDFLMYDYVQRRRTIKIVGLKVNTVGKTVKQFRTFLRNRIRKGIIPPLDMDGWKILEEEVDAVYLNWDEIKKIFQVDLSRYPHLVDYRDDFVLGCMTGLRFSDFSKLMKDDLRGDMLYKKQQKSDHWVVIPLRPEAKKILDDRFNNNTPSPTNAEFNRHIKRIAELAGISENIKHSHKKGNKDIVEVKPKYAWITSHTCRRSFCTNEFLAGTPVELIMKISGHKSVKDFYKYIRVTPEEAGQKIK
ncbi:MAG: phage integrase SAM-like domain-containing protein [Ginsengibacter sp.]